MSSDDEVTKKFVLRTIKPSKEAREAVRELTEAIEKGRPSKPRRSLASDLEEEFGGKPKPKKAKP